MPGRYQLISFYIPPPSQTNLVSIPVYPRPLARSSARPGASAGGLHPPLCALRPAAAPRRVRARLAPTPVRTPSRRRTPARSRAACPTSPPLRSVPPTANRGGPLPLMSRGRLRLVGATARLTAPGPTIPWPLPLAPARPRPSAPACDRQLSMYQRNTKICPLLQRRDDFIKF